VRPILAWLLLLLTSFQWIGGRLCYKVIYTVEISRQMNEAEQALAESIQHETGIIAQVEVLERSEIDIDGIGYSNFFMFSGNVDGETVYYKVNSDPVDLFDHEIYAGQPGSEENSPKMVLLDRLFSDFLLQQAGLPITPKVFVLPARNFHSVDLSDIFPLSSPTPPPESIA
jgi:hypothetical protein